MKYPLEDDNVLMTIDLSGQKRHKSIVTELTNVCENLDTSKINWVEDHNNQSIPSMVMFTKDQRKLIHLESKSASNSMTFKKSVYHKF